MSKKKKIPKNQISDNKDLKKEEFVSQVVGDVMEDDKARSVYLVNLQNAYAQRLMIVNEDDAPWPSAPNYSMPFTDKQIRKRKPVLVGSILNAKKLAIVDVEDGVADPDGSLRARAANAEKLLNMFLRKKMDWLENLVIGVDYLLEKGRVYFKVFTEFKSKYINRTIKVQDYIEKFGDESVRAIKLLSNKEIGELIARDTGHDFDKDNVDHMDILQDIIERFRAGEDEIDYQLEIIDSKPKIMAIPPERIILPPDSPRDTQRCSRITHEYFMTQHELLRAADIGQFDKQVVMDYIASKSGPNDRRPFDVDKDVIEGIATQYNDSQYRLWEIHTYWKESRASREEKWVITVFANQNDGSYLRFIREPNDSDVFPFVAIDHEVRDDRALSSRGIPAMLSQVQKIIDEQENNRMRRDIVANTPFFTVRRQSNILSNSIQYIPGEGLIVDNHDDLAIHNFASNVDLSSERIEQAVKQFGEEYIGSVDFAFNAGATSGTGRSPKTLGEIQIASSEASKITNLDFIIFKNGISRVYEMVFMLIRSNIFDNVEIDNTVITRDDFNFPAEIRSNGTLEESDRMFKVNKALARMQVISSQDSSYVTLEDRYHAYLEYLEADGVEDLSKFSTNPAEVLNTQIVQMQQALQNANVQIQQMNKVLDQKEKTLTLLEEKSRRSDIKAKVKASLN